MIILAVWVWENPRAARWGFPLAAGA